MSLVQPQAGASHNLGVRHPLASPLGSLQSSPAARLDRPSAGRHAKPLSPQAHMGWSATKRKRRTDSSLDSPWGCGCYRTDWSECGWLPRAEGLTDLCVLPEGASTKRVRAERHSGRGGSIQGPRDLRNRPHGVTDRIELFGDIRTTCEGCHPARSQRR
jgi:hypothetical protein